MGAKSKILSGAFGAALVMVNPIVERIEGVKYEVYYDIAGIPTVCAGITGPDVIPGKIYTEGECRALLQKHIMIAANEVNRDVKVPIPVTMRAAMYSFTYNAGTGAFRKSTMLRLINENKLEQACAELWRWTYYRDPKTGKRKQSKGLKNRRAVEYEYCVKEIRK